MTRKVPNEKMSRCLLRLPNQTKLVAGVNVRVNVIADFRRGGKKTGKGRNKKMEMRTGEADWTYFLRDNPATRERSNCVGRVFGWWTLFDWKLRIPISESCLFSRLICYNSGRRKGHFFVQFFL
jgi:hypothetical protein